QQDQATIETLIENITGLPDDQRCFIQSINDRANRYKSRLTIAEHELSERRKVDEKSKKQKSGKRAIIGNNISICTVEIRDGVLTAEKLTLEKKNRKHNKTPKSKAEIPMKVLEDAELNEDLSGSDYSDCIVVRRA